MNMVPMFVFFAAYGTVPFLRISAEGENLKNPGRLSFR